MKIFSKSSSPIIYTRNIDGVMYKIKVDQNGLDISNYPDSVIENLFATWGNLLVNEDQFAEIQKKSVEVPVVTPQVENTNKFEETKSENLNIECPSEEIKVETVEPVENTSEEAPVESIAEVKEEKTEKESKGHKSNLFGRGRKN